MTDSIHVCKVINSLDFGGAEHLLVDLAEAMEEVEFTVISLESSAPLTSSLRDTGARVHHLDERVRFDPRTFASLRRLIDTNEFDIIHNHLPYAQTLGRLAARSVSYGAVVSTQHNVPSTYHPVTRMTERATRRLDDATVAVSQGVERAFTGTAHDPFVFEDDWCTIYNGINIDGYRDAVNVADGTSIRRELEINDSTSLFLNVGRYVQDKSQDVLIEAFAEADLTDAALAIVGHGPLEEDLIRIAEQNGIADRVSITGRVPEVEPYYAAADVFVSSSQFEGLPVTLLEAMASGLPVIASDVPGVSEVVADDETGRLYPYGESETLATLLVEFAETNQSTYGETAYERAKSMFDVEVMAEAHLELYRRILVN